MGCWPAARVPAQVPGQVIPASCATWMQPVASRRLARRYKQLGEAAVEADNVFHPLCYEGAVDFAAITDPRERLAKEAQVGGNVRGITAATTLLVSVATCTAAVRVMQAPQ